MTAGVIDYPRMLRDGLPHLDLYDHRDHVATVPGSALAQAVRRRAGTLAGLGLRRGDRVVLVAANTEGHLTTLLAVLLLGAVPCAVAPPATPSRTESAGVRHLAAAIAVVDPVLVIAPAALAAAVSHPGLVTDGDLAAAQPISLPEQPPAAPGDVHHIQLTSGSTSAPKAVVLSHRNVAHNIGALAAAVGADPGRDRVFSWLPMYHDMGFIQVLGALVHRLPVGLMTPLAFLRDPLSWPRNLTRHGSTITAGPPFAYRAATDSLRRSSAPPDVDLSALRHAFVGAEPIPYPTLREFTDGFAAFGLSADALAPCYGMAETVLATTLSPHRVRVLEHPGGPPLVSCGVPAEGLRIRITDADGTEVPPGTTGEIQVSGPSVMIGYRGPDGTMGEPPDGWHRTGDLGFLSGGELFVVGRTKEMLIVRGRNFPPHDIESAIEALPGVDAGSAVVFSAPGGGGEELVVAVLAAHPGTTGADDLRRAAAAAVRGAFGFSPDDVVVVRRGTIPRTSSGKIQRFAVRDRYLDGRLG